MNHEKVPLTDLIQADMDMQMNMECRDRFWEENLEIERIKINKNREEAETAL